MKTKNAGRQSRSGYVWGRWLGESSRETNVFKPDLNAQNKERTKG